VHEAGSLAGRLPRGTVEQADDRRRAAEIWGVPVERIDPRPGRTALAIFRALERGDIRFLWIQAANPMLSLPNLNRYRRAAAGSGRFIVVSEAYPTATTDVADVVLPAALWIEREGVSANPERRVQHFPRMVPPPGDAASDAWHTIEVGRRLGFAELFPWERARHVEQIWEEYSRFHSDPTTALPPMAALDGPSGATWPLVDGRETKWRYNTSYDRAASAARGGFDFYGHPDHRAWIWLRPYHPPAETPDDAFPIWLVTGAVLEHWADGTLTRRIPTLHRGLPHAYVEINPQDAADRGIRDRERVRLVSRRGAVEVEARINYRSQPPRGQVFVPWFDEGVPVNLLTGDASCPLSGQPDGRKCAVRIERRGP
jgi:nitrate reductase NapA